MMGNGSQREEYEWVSNGGCTRCDALDGRLFPVTPGRPHPNCNCVILDRSEPNTSCDATDVRYRIEHSGNVHHAPTGLDDEFDMVFDYEITCWGNAQTITGQVSVSATYGDAYSVDDFWEDGVAEALAKVDAIAAMECPVCSKHPHVA